MLGARQRVRTRELAFHVISWILVIAAWELSCWAFSNIAAQIGVLHFYHADVFARITDAELARDSRLNPLGWVASEKARTVPSEYARICGYAFGDSFTHGDEAADD
jgi:hypothetical protein